MSITVQKWSRFIDFRFWNYLAQLPKVGLLKVTPEKFDASIFSG